jgi:hypothetical protein
MSLRWQTTPNGGRFFIVRGADGKPQFTHEGFMRCVIDHKIKEPIFDILLSEIAVCRCGHGADRHNEGEVPSYLQTNKRRDMICLITDCDCVHLMKDKEQ